MTTLYLKYRPQTFQELDNSSAREELIKIFRSGQFPHAFLFSGPRGIGKTSAARIVAKAVNCERGQSAKDKGQSYEPCNECASCLSITQGNNIDVLEIDAASNRGIDDIKELREKIKLAPAKAKYKVYIIDEVHMLTTEAFNALLKTLEEPPAHALFLLCTTDPEKLPKTIVSRCQRINFKRAGRLEMVDKLKKICQEEKLEYEEKALEAIAKLADGSFRDANKILERVILSGKVTEGEVKNTAGILAEFKVEEFLQFLEEGVTKEALSWLNRATEEGANLRILTEEILEKLRLLLLADFGLGEEKEEKFKFSAEEIHHLINLFTTAYTELRQAVIPQLPLEMAVIEWGESSKRKSDSDDDASGNESKSKSEEPAPPVSPEPSLTQNSLSLGVVLAKWPEILERVKPLNHSVQAFLKACRPLAIDGSFLMLEVFYKFHKDQLESEKCRRIFEKAASEVLGVPIKLKCSLSETSRPVKPLPVLDNLPPEANLAKPGKPMTVAEGKEDDIIKFAEEIFNKEGGTIQ
jgi:DNA polymerase-3 subunit gamma/tau